MQNSTTEIDPNEIRQMIESIRNDNEEKKVKSLSSLKLIAKALGEARTCTELIPYVSETVDLTESMWSIVAEQLGSMLDEVGGQENVGILLDLLNQISEIEDNEVQEKATQAFISLAENVSVDCLSKSFFPLLLEMCENSWQPLRCAAVGVLCNVLHRFEAGDKKKLMAALHILSSDPVTRVRNSFAKKFSNMVVTSVAKDFQDDIKKILRQFSSDKAVSVLVELPGVLGSLPPEYNEIRLEIAKLLFESDMWQSKVVLIDRMDKIFANVKTELVQRIAKEVTENKGLKYEVKVALARQVPFLYSCKQIQDVDAVVKKLICERNVHIRTAVAKSLGSIKEIQQTVLEEFITSLITSSETQVKLAVMSSVAASSVGIILAARYMPNLIKSGDWRTLVHVTKLLPQMASSVTVEQFLKSFMPIISNLLANQNAEVRKAAIECLAAILLIFKTGLEERIHTIIKSLVTNRDYQLRQTGIILMFRLGMNDKFEEQINALIADPVSNVRLVLAEMAREYNNVKISSKLMEDADKDVAYFSGKQI